MTTLQEIAAAPRLDALLPMPDPPERTPEDMSGFNHLSITGGSHFLAMHLGNPDTTLVAGEHYLAPRPTRDMTGIKFPDLMIAFNVNPEAYYRSNAYIISEQGKPPDFVLEIASRATGRVDVLEKPEAYAALGIPEYWRFDESGRHHGAKLEGDRLVRGTYQPIAIQSLDDGILQGYSEVLNLILRWEEGRLGWYDPATGRHISTFKDERAARTVAEAALRDERAARTATEAALRDERAARTATEAALTTAEARIRALEQQLERRNS